MPLRNMNTAKEIHVPGKRSPLVHHDEACRIGHPTLLVEAQIEYRVIKCVCFYPPTPSDLCADHHVEAIAAAPAFENARSKENVFRVASIGRTAKRCSSRYVRSQEAV